MPSPFPNLPPEQRGKVRCIDHASQVLADNPWGDPTHRDVWVYQPPGDTADHTSLPAIFVLPGYTGTGEKLLARGFSDVSIATRIDRLIADGCPPFLAVLPDCMTTLGGSQYVDSPGLGAYATYLAHEIRPFVEGRFGCSGQWGVVGHSSGGFGALHLAMQFPGVFSAVASHAGDMGFDLCYLADLVPAVRAIQKAGGAGAFVDGFWARRRPSSADVAALMILCMSCAYSPDPTRTPIPARCPVDFETGAVDFEVLSQWRTWDPIVRVDDPAAADALRSLSLLFIDVGKDDEYLLQLGARRLLARLDALSIPHVYEEFDGGHRAMAWRYSESLERVARVLTECA